MTFGTISATSAAIALVFSSMLRMTCVGFNELSFWLLIFLVPPTLTTSASSGAGMNAEMGVADDVGTEPEIEQHGSC